MKLLHILILSLLVSGISASTIAEKDIESKVNDVTVFIKGAQITRKKTVHINAGISILKFTNLSPFIDAKSIQVKANGALSVLSVNHQKNYLNEMKKSEALQTLEQDLETIDENLQLEYTYQNIIKEELDFLKENRNITGKNDQLSLTNLQQTSAYYGKRLTELKLKEIEHQKTIKSLNLERHKLLNQINAAAGKKEFPAGEVLVKVDVKQTGKVTLELSYLVDNAGWYPSYDIRAKNINEPVELIYKANVRQDTKVDWKDVKLTFSSSDPKISGVAPELKTYYLDYHLLPPSYKQSINEVSGRVVDESNAPIPGVNVVVLGTTIGTTTNMDGYYSITTPNNAAQLVYSFVGMNSKTLPISNQNMNVRLEHSALALDEVIVTGYGSENDFARALQGKVAGVSSRAKKEKSIKIRGMSSLAIPTAQVQKQTTVNFEIKTPYTIASDNKSYTVDMDAYQLASSYQYYCVPKVERDAFLLAQITDWKKYNLLEGEANIFFEDTYIGKTLLDVRYASDTLDISLGRDKQVVVTREKIKNYTTKQFIGNKKEESKAWKTLIRNTKNQTINMIVLDQVPVSSIEEIEVKIEDLSKGLLNTETGEVNWKFELESSSKKELELRYLVKYPKNQNLVIE